MRDDFTVAVATTLARRAGFRCSNPACERPTSGPERGGPGWVSIGNAAHIAAASPGGPRFDALQTPAERSSQENGVWLCAICAKLIDSDSEAYPAEMLRTWRANAERSAAIALSERGHMPSSSEGVCYEAERLMPALIREMRADVQGDETEVVRKFWVMTSPGIVISTLDGAFRYDRQAHPHVYNQTDWLSQMALVSQERFDASVRMYRFSPMFHRWLRETENPKADE
jgi:hypothetical protein